jgi:hypothetical protein
VSRYDDFLEGDDDLEDFREGEDSLGGTEEDIVDGQRAAGAPFGLHFLIYSF